MVNPLTNTIFSVIIYFAEQKCALFGGAVKRVINLSTKKGSPKSEVFGNGNNNV